MISKKHDCKNYRIKTANKKRCMNMRHLISQGIWMVSNATRRTIFHALLSFQAFEMWLSIDSMNGLMDDLNDK